MGSAFALGFTVMKRKKYLICFGLILAVLSAACFFLMKPSQQTCVEIVQEDRVLYRINLSECEDQTFSIVYEGRENVIQILDGKIRVLEADCPDHTCVRMGWLRSDALPIVCLPNRLVIRFCETNAIDAST